MSDERAEEAGNPGAAPEERRRLRVRWRRVLPWLALTALVLPLVLAGVLWTVSRTQFGTDRALDFVNRQLESAGNLRLRAARVVPTAGGVRLREPVVEVRHDGDWYEIVRARRIDVRLSVWDLFWSRAQTYAVEAEAPVFTLRYDEAGQVMLPELRGRGEGGRRPGDGYRLRLDDARFLIQRADTGITWWSRGRAEALAISRGGARRFELIELGGRIDPLGLELDSGLGRATLAGRRLEVEQLTMETDAGTLRLGGWMEDEALGFDLEGDRWPWEFFAELLEQPVIDVPGTVDVRGRLEGTLEAPTVAVTLDGRWRDEPFSAEIEGGLEADAVRVARADLRWRRARLVGEGRIGLDGSWVVDAVASGLDLSELRRLGIDRDLPPSDMTGPVRLEGSGGRFQLTARGASGVVHEIPFRELRGTWTVDGRRMRWDVRGWAAGGPIELRGAWDGRRLALEAEGGGQDLARLTPVVPELAGIEGRAERFDLSLSGPTSALAVTGSADLTGGRWRRFAAGEVSFRAKGRWGEEAIAFTAEGEDVAVAGRRFPRAEVNGEVAPGHFDLKHVRLASPDTVVSGALVAERRGDLWHLRIDPLHYRGGPVTLAAEEPIVLRIGPEGAELESAALRGPSGRLAIAGRFGRREEMELELELDDLAIGDWLPIEDPELAGRLDGHVELAGSEGLTRLEVELTGDTLRYRSRGVERVAIQLALERQGARWRVSEIQLASGESRLAGDLSLTLAEAELPAGVEGWKRALREAEAWSGTLEAGDLDLALIGLAGPAGTELEGRLDARLAVGGRPAEPTFVSTGNGEALAWNGFRLERAEWELRYADRRLEIDPLVGVQKGVPLRVTGRLPLDLALGVEGERLWEGPIELDATVPEGDLALLPPYVPLLADARGRLDLSLRLRGTPDEPELRGSVAIRDGEVRFTAREEIYRGLEADLRFEDERVTVERIVARQAEGGRYAGSGTIQLDGLEVTGFALELRATDATAFATGEYSVQFDGGFRIGNGPRLEGNPIPLPRIVGDVQVRSGVILYDFADPSNRVYLVGPQQMPTYLYELDLEAPGRVYWRTPNANIEMRADLHLERSLEERKIWGEIEAIRGTYFFLENEFRLVDGTLTFDQVETLNPLIDAEARASVTRGLGQNELERETIHIELSGRVQSPTVRLWSESGLPEKDIVALLTYGRLGLDGGEGGLSSRDRNLLVGVAGTQYLVRQLAREFPEVSPLLSDVEVGTTVGEGSSGDERVYTTVGVSRYFTPDLRLRYSQVVGGASAAGDEALEVRDLSAEYRIGKIFFLTGEVVQRRNSSPLGSATQQELEYNLDLRARYEY